MVSDLLNNTLGFGITILYMCAGNKFDHASFIYTFNITELESRIDEDDGSLILNNEDDFAAVVKRSREGTTDKLRDDGSNEEFKMFAELCFAPMISRQKWNRNHFIVDLSSMITVADEAFALLTMENNVNEWIDQATKDEDKHEKGTSTKYTGKGMNKDGTKKGWTLDGKKRFNKIFDEVTRLRATRKSVAKETWAKAQWITEAEKGKGKNQNVRGEGGEGENEEELQRMRDEERFVPRNGFEN